MIETIVGFFKDLPAEIITIVISALPVSELRGAIPYAYFRLDMPLYKIFLFSYIGNMLPVIPLLVLLKPVSERLRHFRIWHRFFEWLFTRTRQRADIVQRYEALGLILLVAIPLPATGAWTGCIAASLFNIKFKYAFPAVACGVFIAACVVTLLVVMGGSLNGWGA